MIPPDVEKFVARRFDASAQREALRLLQAAALHDGSAPGARLLRCAAVASGGSLERLRMEVETLRRDYRDVIVEGEYVPHGRELAKVRDLNQPIPLAIGCLGWGSLVWNPGNLPVCGTWFEDGPLLPIEFARQSGNGRITLVICDVAHRVRACWTLLEVADLPAARKALAAREGVKDRRIRAFIGHWEAASGRSHGAAATEIARWAREKNLDGVVWANLEIGLESRRGVLPTIDEVLDYLRGLSARDRRVAEEYVRRAPPRIDTEYRRRIAREFGWGAHEA